MKIHLLIEFTLLLSSGWCDKLTTQENKERSENCGTPALETGNDGDEIETGAKSWLVRVSIDKPGQFDTTGSFISNRHIITSSQVVLNDQDMWTTDGKNSHFNCKKGAEIPSIHVEKLKITSGECKNKDECKGDRVTHYTAKKAWMLYCADKNDYLKFYNPMLVEINEKTSNFACFQIDITDLTTNDKLELYGIEYTDHKNIDSSHSKLEYRFRQYKGMDDKSVLVSKLYVFGDRGGPAILRKNGKDTVIAIGGTTGYDDKADDTYYWWNFRDTLCEHSGICDPSKIKTTTESQESSTSEEPETTPDEPTAPTTPDPEDEREPKTVHAPDFDDDDDEDEVTVGAPAEMQGDDETDLFVGDDFFNAAMATSWTTIFNTLLFSLLCAYFF